MFHGIVFLFAFFVVAPFAIADTLPSGCYVTDAERLSYSGSYSCDNCDPPACFNSSDGYYYFMTPASASPNQLVSEYGEAVYVLINSGYQNGLQSSANYSAYQAQVKLVKKLRKACGAKCRRIK